jgi:fatty acid synthase
LSHNIIILKLGDIEALQIALNKDKGIKGRRTKKLQKRLRRSGKKNKRKKEKDLTPDRTIESLFEELLTQGIIKLNRKVSLDEFMGEKSFANYELHEKEKYSLPTLGIYKNIFFIKFH